MVKLAKGNGVTEKLMVMVAPIMQFIMVVKKEEKRETEVRNDKKVNTL